MRVIAEFVDARNGKRYFPGDGDKVDPPLSKEQVTRLTAAGCLADGDEEKPAKAGAGKGDAVDYKTKTVAELKKMAADRKVDLGDATTKGPIIAVLEAADAAAKGEE